MQPANQDAKAWMPVLARYREPHVTRSFFELLITAVPFVILWTLMWMALSVGYWLCLLLAVPNSRTMSGRWSSGTNQSLREASLCGRAAK